MLADLLVPGPATSDVVVLEIKIISVAIHYRYPELPTGVLRRRRAVAVTSSHSIPGFSSMRADGKKVSG